VGIKDKNEEYWSERENRFINTLEGSCRSFFKLGIIGFGGPAAHIAMMENEVVSKRKWMSREHFLYLIGATNLIPGPNSTEMAMHCGYHRAGWAGMIVAGMGEVLVLLAGGLLGMCWLSVGQKRDGVKTSFFPPFFLSAKSGYPEASLAATILSTGQIAGNISLVKLFLVFLKIGSVLFGSGYVLIAYLHDELIDRLGWLTQQQLVDAIAVGEFTPGPVSSAVTFVGYQIIGIKGAILATVGMFLPSFFFVAMLNPFIPKMRTSKWVSYFLDSVNVGAVAIMAVAVIQLARASLINWQTWLIALMGVAVTFVFKKVNTIWIVVGSAIVGYILTKF